MTQEENMSHNIEARRGDIEIFPGEWRKGVWVVRDENGEVLNWSRYRNDLLCQFPNMTIVGD